MQAERERQLQGNGEERKADEKGDAKGRGTKRRREERSKLHAEKDEEETSSCASRSDHRNGRALNKRGKAVTYMKKGASVVQM